MVGDGVNDAAALAQASATGLGLAMGYFSEQRLSAISTTLATTQHRPKAP